MASFLLAEVCPWEQHRNNDDNCWPYIYRECGSSHSTDIQKLVVGCVCLKCDTELFVSFCSNISISVPFEPAMMNDRLAELRRGVDADVGRTSLEINVEPVSTNPLNGLTN